jgi:hypothetical protein
MEPIQHSWYIAKLVYNIVSCYPVEQDSSKEKPRLAIKIRPFYEADFDHLWASQVVPEPVPPPDFNQVNTEEIQCHCPLFASDPDQFDIPDI